MTPPRITGSELAGTPSLPLLLVGPSLGTSAATLWSEVAERVGESFHVVGWELPGHAGALVGEPFIMAELAAGVLAFADGVAHARGDTTTTFVYAGNSLGGCVGLCLLLDAPTAVTSAVVVGSGARIGMPEQWRERAALVRTAGTGALADAAVERWFAPGFVEREPSLVAALLAEFRAADPEGYAQACEALAGFDVHERLSEIGTPLLAVAGAHDGSTPPAQLSTLIEGVRTGRLVVLDGIGHLAPAEDPDRIAALLRDHLTAPPKPTLADMQAAGTAVRREVLGDTHVDRATAAITDLTADFQALITRYAWGSIWTRPGLDRRSRSMITLTALIARGHHEEFATHLRAALRNGLTRDEIREVLLQSAIYCGVPDANTAFRIAQEVLHAPELR